MTFPGSGLGILGFANQPQYPVIFLDGQPLIGGFSKLDRQSATGDPVLLPTQAGTHVQQRIFRGGSAPSSLRARTFNLTIQTSLEEDYFRVQSCIVRGAAVLFFDGIPITDAWYYATGMPGFTTSRPLCYGGVLNAAPPIDTTICPLRAFLNGVEKAVITTGSPSSSQVKVSTAAYAQHDALTLGFTPSSGDLIELRYYPLYWVTFDPQDSLAAANDQTWTGTLHEAVQGDFT